MKKNRMMRCASGLLVAVLLTTSMIAGTFAKYTTQDSGSDMARVAKWGVELQVAGNLYGDTYKDTIVEETATEITVQSNDKSADVVAPGTKNDDGFTFSLKGQPEVAGEVTTEMKIQNVFLKSNTYGVMIPVDAGTITAANFDEFAEKDAVVKLYTETGGKYTEATVFAEDAKYYTLEDEVVLTKDYYPVVYALTGKTKSTGSTTADSLELAAKAIAYQLGIDLNEDVSTDKDTTKTYTGTKSFDCNTDLADWNVDGLKLTWEWKICSDETACTTAQVGDDAQELCKADTILGMLENTTEGAVVKIVDEAYEAVVEYTDYCLDTQFSIDITVTQVD